MQTFAHFCHPSLANHFLIVYVIVISAAFAQWERHLVMHGSRRSTPNFPCVQCHTHTHRQSRVLQSNTFWPAWHFFSSMTLSERLHTPTEQCCLATACAIEKWMCSCFKQAIYTRDSYTLLFKEVSLQTFTLAFCSACHESHEAKTKGGTTSTKGSNEKLRSVNTQFVLQMSSRFFSSGSSI